MKWTLAALWLVVVLPLNAFPERVFWEVFLQRTPGLERERVPDIWILGWSKEGALGLLENWENGFSIKVYDLVSDQLLFQDEKRSSGIQEYLERHQGLLDQIILQFSLAPTDLQPAMYPFMSKERYFQPKMEIWKDAYDFVIQGYEVSLQASGLGKKIIGRKEKGPWAAVHLLAFLPSPFEQRVAFFVLELPYGFPLNPPPKWTVIGAHLGVGFQ